MCTLIVSFQQHESAPLLIAANRDELRARPAVGPFLWPAGFVAPRDEQGGGTWLGLTRTGLFVGVTNRFPSQRFPERQSRGQLVVEALQAASASALRRQLEGLPVDRFNTFHLLYADLQHAFVTWSDGARVHHQQLAPGLHVVTERSLGGDDRGRTKLIESRWPTLERLDGVPTPEALQQLLATPADEPAGGVCVDLPAFDYGTRSSLVLSVAPTLARSRWFWADGRPDRTPFVEEPQLIEALAS
ncbi:MAG: NRDE family protein [Myxococcota bacterium]